MTEEEKWGNGWLRIQMVHDDSGERPVVTARLVNGEELQIGYTPLFLDLYSDWGFDQKVEGYE